MNIGLREKLRMVWLGLKQQSNLIGLHTRGLNEFQEDFVFNW